MTSKVLYLLHPPDYYGKVFMSVGSGPKKVSNHYFYQSPFPILVAEKINQQTLNPQNFLKLSNAYSFKTIVILDCVKFPTAIDGDMIQITDHRNLSGWNPLIGKTPINNLPRFPDISDCYSQIDNSLPRLAVTTVGTERFHNEENGVEGVVSEASALVSLSAAYIGLNVESIGWNNSRDKGGKNLENWIGTNF